jgi:SAM-dependent methyltransferase
MITQLPRVVAAPPDRPKVGTATHPMRIVTRRTAFEPNFWSPAEATRVAGFFDDLASGWDTRLGSGELMPLDDALARGGPFGPRCLEIGAGTGKGTEILVGHFADVYALDLSLGMLRHFADIPASLILGDGAHLPLADASVDAIVLVNAFLFPAELDRVLAPGGAIIWVNSLAEDTPIHLPAADVVKALPGAWTAIASEAGWGSWAVVRRA